MFVSGKGKDDYFTGAFVPPEKDAKHNIWKVENNMVVSWLINTMDCGIGDNLLFYDIAHEI